MLSPELQDFPFPDSLQDSSYIFFEWVFNKNNSY